MRRIVFLLPCGISMLMGVDAALVLMGLPAPLRGDRFIAAHGMLMVIGFVGALVSLERAVSIKRWWAYLAPLGMSLGSLIVLTPAPMRVGQAIMIIGAVCMMINYGVLWSRNREPLVAVQCGGGITALGAVIVWTGGAAIPDLLAWLVSFLTLTVIAERLDLSRIGQLALSPKARQRHEDSLILLAALTVLACPLTTLWPTVMLPVYGLLLILLAIQSARGDVARRGVRSPGANRFTAVMILIGYGWLAVAGLLLLRPALSGLHYDATLHALFLGFVMSMVAAHAPTILPTLLGVRMRFVAGFWGVGALLHLSLAVRIIADLLGSESGRSVGGIGNIAALLSLVAVAIWASTTHDENAAASNQGQASLQPPTLSPAGKSA